LGFNDTVEAIDFAADWMDGVAKDGGSKGWVVPPRNFTIRYIGSFIVYETPDNPGWPWRILDSPKKDEDASANLGSRVHEQREW
jgi:hypothetical protein